MTDCLAERLNSTLTNDGRSRLSFSPSSSFFLPNIGITGDDKYPEYGQNPTETFLPWSYVIMCT